MNGIGGSVTLPAMPIFPSLLARLWQKEGKISAIVPMVSHEDHSEHDVNILITEQGVADLRGKSPVERAKAIIENCAHPDYQEHSLGLCKNVFQRTNSSLYSGCIGYA